MKFAPSSRKLRLFAALTILSFSFTQAAPAWALRTGIEGIQSGLEEALTAAGAVSGLEEDPAVRQAVRVLSRLVPRAGSPPRGILPKLEANRIPSSEVVVALWSVLDKLPEGEKTLPGKVLSVLNVLEAFRQSAQPPRWDAQTVRREIEEIASHAPGEFCATCAARGLVSLASDPAYALTESLQPASFQDAENITALMIALDVWATGRVQSVTERRTGHQVFANTLGSVQAVYQASELGLANGLRREWLPRILSPSQLREAVGRGPVLVHVGADHYARIVAADAQTVTLEEMLPGPGGAPVQQLSFQAWPAFLNRWSGTAQTGVALVAVQGTEHSIPGRPVPSKDLGHILGCCGVSNASGLDWLFSRAEASQRIVRVLESRGFDNFASAHKMVLELPEDFDLEADRYEGLRGRIEQARTTGEEDVIFVPASDGRPPELRFFAVSRGVGSATANADVIETDIAQQVREIARLVHGDDVEVRRSAFAGHWHVMRGHKKVTDIRERAVADHTRFKTKGGDRRENAHHKPYKGVSLGENGDLSEYEAIRALQAVDFGQSFEGTADWEPITHVIGDLHEEKNADGNVVGHVPLWQASVRAMRLLENFEAFMRASEVLQPGYLKGDKTAREQEAVRRKLQALGFDDAKLKALTQTVEIGGRQVPVFVREFFGEAVRNPALMDREASEENGWRGYYRHLGAQLPQTHDSRFDNFKAINLSLNALSIYDDATAVVTRTYPKSTSFYFGFDRNEEGKTEGILGGSETRGFAPLIGKAQGEPIPIREGIVDLVSGEVERLEAQAWSVYTVRDTRLVSHGIWDDASEEFTQGEWDRIKWMQIHPGKEKEYREWTDFRLETQAQPITLGLTIRALTVSDASGARRVRLGDATEAPGEVGERLNRVLADPATKIYGAGSGTSFHALLLTDQRYGLFDRVASSDEWGSTLPVNLIRHEVAAGRPPLFMVVSQSGATGSAKALAQRLAELGAIVVVTTNRPGSDLYIATKDKSGVVVTESVEEVAVAATGSNSSQVAALEFFAMKRQEALAGAQKKSELGQRHSRRIDEMVALTTYQRDDGSLYRGFLEDVLDSFEPPARSGEAAPANLNAVRQVVDFMKGAGLKEAAPPDADPFADSNKHAFRKTNVILTGLGPVAQAIAPETSLKVMEVTRKLASFVPAQQLLAYGIDGRNPRDRFEPWDAESGAASVEATLRRYTTGLPERVGRYPYFPGLRADDPRLTEASQVVLLGDGEDLVTLDYIVSRYQPHSTVPVRRALYGAAPEHLVRDRSLVIAVQPWTHEQRELLERYRQEGATVVVVGSGERPLEEDARVQAEREGAFLPTEGRDWEFAQVTLLDLLMMRVMEALRVRSESVDYTRPGFIAEQVGMIEAQVGGIRAVKSSFERQAEEPVHRNLETLTRFKGFAKRRGWDHFEWWSTGKGVRFPAARDLALRIWARTGKAMEAAELSEFKHGRNGATNSGDVFVNFWSPRGTQDGDDDRKTAIDEEVPRIADYPYPIFGEKEPGVILLIAAEDDNDPYLKHLSTDEYRQLRQARRKAASKEDTNRPDLVFVTPHSGILEQMALNRILSEELSAALFDALEEAERSWEEVAPRNLVINIDVGEIFPGKRDLYRALRESFPSERSRILSVVPDVGSGVATPHSDETIIVPTTDPIAFLVVGHQLTSRLVDARFDGVLNFLVDLNNALADEIAKGPDGEIGKYAPEFQTPGDLVMAFALGNADAERALKAFSTARGGQFEGLKEKILDILDWYNVDPIKGVKAARNLPELKHSEVDLIEKLAKVVTNFSPIGVAEEAPEPFRFARMPVTMTGADQIEVNPEAAAALAQDEIAADHLRRVLEETHGAEALKEAAGDNGNLAEVLVRRSAHDLTEVLSRLRERYPTLPENVEVVLEVRGPRLAHQTDGRLVLNANALRHPRLMEEQIEHEILHELAQGMGEREGIDIPDGLETETGLSANDIWNTLIEAAIIELEAERHFGFTADDRHAVREVLQGPNVVDTHGRFDRFLTAWSGASDGAARHRLALKLVEEAGGPQSVQAANLLRVADPARLGGNIDALKAYFLSGRAAEAVPPEAHAAALGRPILLPAGGVVAPTMPVPELPGDLEPHRAQIEALVRDFSETNEVQIRVFPGPEAGQSLLVVAGPREAPGLLDMLVHPLAGADINIRRVGEVDFNGVGVDYVVADAAMEELKRDRVSGVPETSLLDEMERTRKRRFSTAADQALQEQFQKWHLDDFERNQLAVQYRDYHGVPRLTVGKRPDSEEILITAIAPYSGALRPDFREELEALASKPLSTLPSQEEAPPVSIVRHYEYDEPHPLVFILVELTNADLPTAFRIEDALEAFLNGGISAPEEASGLEERYVTTGDRVEIPVEEVLLPVTFGLQPGRVGLLQWAEGPPNALTSRFALIRADASGQTLTLLDRAEVISEGFADSGGNRQFTVADFRPSDSQVMQGARLPGAVEEVDWSAATEAGSSVVIDRDGENPVPVIWNAGTRALTVELPAPANVIFHQLEGGLEEAATAPIAESPAAVTAPAGPPALPVAFGTAPAVSANAPVLPAALAVEREAGVPAPRRIRLGTEIYGLIFADPAGLAVGVTLQFAEDRSGRRMPQRFVAANEAQEQALLELLSEDRHAEILRAWEHGGVAGAIEVAENQLMAEGVMPWPVRSLPSDFPGLLQEISKLAALLKARAFEYNPSKAARIVLKLYDRFA